MRSLNVLTNEDLPEIESAASGGSASALERARASVEKRKVRTKPHPKDLVKQAAEMLDIRQARGQLKQVDAELDKAGKAYGSCCSMIGQLQAQRAGLHIDTFKGDWGKLAVRGGELLAQEQVLEEQRTKTAAYLSSLHEQRNDLRRRAHAAQEEQARAEARRKLAEGAALLAEGEAQQSQIEKWLRKVSGAKADGGES